MNAKRLLEKEAEAFAKVFEDTGSLILLPFLDALMNDYDGKTDFRDFTREERREILLNTRRMMEILEDPKEDEG
jgi:tRNA U38,U39,U40 pseudouridine synthase TruA